MSRDKKSYDSECGEMQYFPQPHKCECCKDTKHRRYFIVITKEDNKAHYRLSSICSDCRIPFAKPPKTRVKFDAPGGKPQDISSPAIIDWMYKNIK